MEDFRVGQLYRRTELHGQFGGQRQGGISTPAKYPFVFIVTGESGKQYGYADKWNDDGIFLYSGEGQHGDMKFVAGNRAIRDHVAEGKTIHLFEQYEKDKRFLRYIGEMTCVGSHPEAAADVDGNQRQAIIFHLRPAGSICPDRPTVEAALAPELPGRATSHGGGFGSVEHNRQVERAAVAEVRRQYERDGWSVVSVEAEKVGYDLKCAKETTEEHVEVKGAPPAPALPDYGECIATYS